MPSPSAPSREINASGEVMKVHGKTTLNDEQLSYEYFNHPPVAGSTSQPRRKFVNGENVNFWHGVYGPGVRVPMYVISPWSRGGWVNSQVFDHTSIIQFLEQRFGVDEPNISPYRRAVCGMIEKKEGGGGFGYLQKKKKKKDVIKKADKT